MSIPSRRKFWGGPGNSPSPGPHRLPPLHSLGAGWGRRGGTLLPSPLPPPATPSAAAPDPPQPSPTLGLREHTPAGRAEPWTPRSPPLPRSLRSRRGSSGDTDTGARIPRRAIFGKQGPTAAGTTARSHCPLGILPRSFLRAAPAGPKTLSGAGQGRDGAGMAGRGAVLPRRAVGRARPRSALEASPDYFAGPGSGRAYIPARRPAPE